MIFPRSVSWPERPWGGVPLPTRGGARGEGAESLPRENAPNFRVKMQAYSFLLQ